MKRQLLYIVATLGLLLAACTEEGAKEQQEDHSNNDSIIEEEGGKEAAVENEQRDPEIIAPLYELDSSWGFQPIDDADEQVVLLTIDDAPDQFALDMAKTLKTLDAPAIFFVNGHFLHTDEERKVLQEIHDMGFAIGNHTKTHAKLTDLTEEEQYEEIMFVSDAVEEIIGERPKFFRAPHGINTDYSKQLVAGDGMLLMNWTYGYDWEKQYMDAEALADIMVNTELMRDGANLLMHDREWTAEALEDIIEGLRAKDYQFIDPKTIQGVAE